MAKHKARVLSPLARPQKQRKTESKGRDPQRPQGDVPKPRVYRCTRPNGGPCAVSDSPPQRAHQRGRCHGIFKAQSMDPRKQYAKQEPDAAFSQPYGETRDSKRLRQIITQCCQWSARLKVLIHGRAKQYDVSTFVKLKDDIKKKLRAPVATGRPRASQKNRRVAARSSPTSLAGGVGRDSCWGFAYLSWVRAGRTPPCGWFCWLAGWLLLACRLAGYAGWLLGLPNGAR